MGSLVGRGAPPCRACAAEAPPGQPERVGHPARQPPLAPLYKQVEPHVVAVAGNEHIVERIIVENKVKHIAAILNLVA